MLLLLCFIQNPFCSLTQVCAFRLCVYLYVCVLMLTRTVWGISRHYCWFNVFGVNNQMSG